MSSPLLDCFKGLPAMPNRVPESVTLIRSRYNQPVKVGMVLGSGLGDFAERLENKVRIPYPEIPHFQQSAVEGHAGNLVLGTHQNVGVVCMQGRFHYYEGHNLASVTYPIRVMKKLGATHLIVTNAAGGINTSFDPGTLMLITDHINLMGHNPLNGKNWADFGPRFPDMSNAYDNDLQDVARAVAAEKNIALKEGVYVAVSGPSYETPAEIKMLRTLGADAVGMSTVPEVIVAKHMGMQVLGVSCITNPAAGVSDEPLSHAEVTTTAARVQETFMTLLSATLDRLAGS